MKKLHYNEIVRGLSIRPKADPWDSVKEAFLAAIASPEFILFRAHPPAERR
jgi:hypothetical protein